MTWQVRLSDRAIRDLQSLQRGTRARILAKLEKAGENPARYFRRLTHHPESRMRVGDHRVLAHLDAEARTIDVMHVGHRRNVYG